ncbi:hypothetical protein FE257_009705 [Aspergillus nanangensis]|uniref:Uncharacterized protein n=1 Tax=Aspergillus nanangensis TaxID=2582783 RepID=A0AAD4CK44_ASPNN|nr:hypothetical protein FE257_009705 [Aspergillus nanangensis]
MSQPSVTLGEASDQILPGNYRTLVLDVLRGHSPSAVKPHEKVEFENAAALVEQENLRGDSRDQAVMGFMCMAWKNKDKTLAELWPSFKETQLPYYKKLDPAN